MKNVGYKKKVLSWVLNSDRVGRSRRPAGSEFQTDEAMKLNEHPHFFILFFNCFLESVILTVYNLYVLTGNRLYILGIIHFRLHLQPIIYSSFLASTYTYLLV